MSEDTEDNKAPVMNDSVEEAIQFAKKYLEDILSFFGLNIDVYATTEDQEVIELNVPSSHMNGFLIGQRGDTMRSMQAIVSTALRNANFAMYRVNVDIADYKKARAVRLAETAQDWVDAVKESGKEMHLKPMNAADRRTLHKLADEQGLETESIGEGRDRHIVIKPTKGADNPVVEEEGEEESDETSKDD